MIARAMIYTIIAGFPVLGAAVVVSGLLRRHGRLERGVWLSALALVVLLPAWMMARPVRVDVAAATQLVTLAPATRTPPGPWAEALASSGRMPWDELLLALWLAVSLSLAVRWALSAARLSRLARSWDSEIVEGVQVWMNEEVGPAVTGVLHPRIVIPTWVRRLPRTSRCLVLKHEEEHVRGRDHWLAALVRGACIVTPWNPVVWLTGAGLKRAIELDCDRRVLRRHPDVAAYGATLLAVSGRGRGLLVTAAFAESDVPMRRRILAMTTPAKALSLPSTVVAVVVGAGMLIGATLVPAPLVRFTLQVASRTSADAQTPSLPAPRVIDDPITPRVNLGTWRRTVTATATMWMSPDGRWMAYAAVPGPSPVLTRYIPPRLTQAPRLLNPDDVAAAIAHAYPRRLLDQGVGGTVALQFQLDANGTVQRTRIGQISMYPELDSAALSIAGIYRFSPAMSDDGPVWVWVVHPVEFRAP